MKKQYWPLLIIIFFAAIAWFSGLYEYFSWQTLKEHHHFMKMFVERHLFWAAVIYCACYITIVSLSIPGAAVMTIAGGFLFGHILGVGLVILSATIGASVLFLSIRLAFTDGLSRKADPWLAKMRQGFQENAFFYLLTLRLLPFVPFVAINLGAAVLQISFKIFFWGTLIGIIPGSFIYVSVGTGLESLFQTDQELTLQGVFTPQIILALSGLALLALLPILYDKFRWI